MNSNKKRKQNCSFKSNLRAYFSEFSQNTGIHGCKYIGETEKTLCERISWLIFFLVSLYICASLIKDTWNKWESSPVLVSFATSPTPVWQIPFPAVTICSEMKIKQSEFDYSRVLEQIKRKIEKVDEDDLQKFEASSLICDNYEKSFEERSEISLENTIHGMLNFAPSINDVFHECQWATEVKNCSEIFHPLLTDDGICFTFNMLNRDELLHKKELFPRGVFSDHSTSSNSWHLETGYLPETDYPHRVFSAGVNAGLILTLKSNQSDFDYSCRSAAQGFRLLLHDPSEIPRIHRHFFRLPLDEEFAVSVAPEIMRTSKGLRAYKPERRGCYFRGEKELKYYRVYTRQNCVVECFANYTMKLCGCVSYHMPRDDDSVRICGTAKRSCLKIAEDYVLKGKFESNCGCLPACTSISYTYETSQGFYNWKGGLAARNDSSLVLFPGLMLNKVMISFKEMQFFTSERNELYGQADFIANCGGLLGIFTGFSFLSCVEIFYYIGLRWFFNVRIYGRSNWSGSNDQNLMKKE